MPNPFFVISRSSEHKKTQEQEGVSPPHSCVYRLATSLFYESHCLHGGNRDLMPCHRLICFTAGHSSL